MTFAAVLQRLQKLENPYPGLRHFEMQESHLFFGRDQLISELVDRLGRNRFVAVVGVSGSGKSSLVRAGLIPALERGHVWEAGVRWRIVVSRPAGMPFQNLALDLAKVGLDASVLRQSSHGLIQIACQLAGDESLLVVVDQFEELFRYKEQDPVTAEAKRDREAAAAEAAEFVQLLLAASRHHPPIYIVLTMRSDYLGDCAEFRDLPETLNDCQYLVPRMSREQRKEAIEGPLGRTQIAPSLVQRMLNDAGDEPDQLPILQHALMRTWSQWHKADPKRSRRIELQDYEAVGGFEKALDQHGGELLACVPVCTAASIFKRLTARGRSSRERRDPATLSELWAVCGAETPEDRARIAAVVDHFRRGEATFLTPRIEQVRDLGPETYIDITHECLIRQWKKLRDEWSPEERNSANTFLYLVKRAGRETLSGLGLAEAVEWDRKRNKTTAWARHYADEAALGTVLEFIKASQAEERKRAIRAKRNLWIAVGLALLFAVLASSFWYQRIKAVSARKDAEAQRIQADQARIYAQDQAHKAEGNAETAQREEKNARDQTAIANLAKVDSERQRSVAERIAYIANLGLARAELENGDRERGWELLDAYWPHSGRDHPHDDFRDFYWYYLWRHNLRTFRLEPFGTYSSMRFNALAFSPDGSLLAIGGVTGANLHTEVWHVKTRQEAASVDVDGEWTNSVAFSPDGQLLATGGDFGTLELWDALSGKEKVYPRLKEVATLESRGHSILSVAFSPDGRLLARGGDDGTVRMWDVQSRQGIAALKGHQGPVTSVVFSPDGRFLATASGDNTVKLWDVLSRQEIATLKGHQGPVNSVGFSPGGRFLATASGDKTVRLWDVLSRQEIATLKGHQGPVNSVVFSPDGRFLATASGDNTVKLWDVLSRQEIATLKGHQGPVDAVAISPDGRLLASSGEGNTLELWDISNVIEGNALKGLTSEVASLAFSHDGRLLATAGKGNTVTLWNMVSRQKFTALKGGGDLIDSLAFAPDDHLLIGTVQFHTVALWDLRSGREPTTMKVQGDSVFATALSPDGQLLAIAGDELVELRDAHSGKHLSALLTGVDTPFSMIFSPDGRLLATQSSGGVLDLWEVKSRKRRSLITKYDGGTVSALAFSPSGGLLASSSRNAVKLWDVQSGQETGTLTGHRDAVVAVAISPDGRLLASASADATVKLWGMQSQQEIGTLRGSGTLSTAEATSGAENTIRKNIRSLAFSPDGRVLAGILDGGVILWTGATDEELAYFYLSRADSKPSSLSFNRPRIK